jgi:hypothetical protein
MKHPESRYNNPLIKVEKNAEAAGYLSVATIEELQLSDEELAKLRLANRSLNFTRFFRADRSDGQIVKVIVALNGTTYHADFFSPALHEGHINNRDFGLEELNYYFDFAKND